MKYLSRILASNHRSDGIHVLCYSEAWGQGGVETFLMSIFRRWQGKGFYFTLFSCWDWNLALDAELEALGIDRFTVFPDSKPGQVKRLCEGSAAFGALINEIRPDAVYVNTMNGMGFLYSEVAQKHGVPGCEWCTRTTRPSGQGRLSSRPSCTASAGPRSAVAPLFASPAPPTQGITSSVPAPSRS